MAEVATKLGITKHLTQRALRRTFNDLSRAAQVNDVTRSISGHLTQVGRKRKGAERLTAQPAYSPGFPGLFCRRDWD